MDTNAGTDQIRAALVGGWAVQTGALLGQLTLNPDGSYRNELAGGMQAHWGTWSIVVNNGYNMLQFAIKGAQPQAYVGPLGTVPITWPKSESWTLMNVTPDQVQIYGGVMDRNQPAPQAQPQSQPQAQRQSQPQPQAQPQQPPQESAQPQQPQPQPQPQQHAPGNWFTREIAGAFTGLEGLAAASQQSPFFTHVAPGMSPEAMKAMQDANDFTLKTMQSINANAEATYEQANQAWDDAIKE